MALGERKDPYLSFNFLVEIKGLVVGGFTEATGLQGEIEVKDYREGGLNEYVHKLPGPTKYPQNLVLKHGVSDSDVLWKWYLDVTQGKIKSKNGSIVFLDAAGEEKWRWNFIKAYPVRWSGPDMRASSAEVAVETFELVHQGIVREMKKK